MNQEFPKQQLLSNGQLLSPTRIQNLSYLLKKLEKRPKNCSDLPNGYAITRFFGRYILSQYINTLCWFFSFVLLIIWFELDVNNNYYKDLILWSGTIFHFVCILTHYINYKSFNDYKDSSGLYDELKRPCFLIIQILILLIRPYPFLKNVQLSLQNNYFPGDQTHKLNHILCIISLNQAFMVVPIFFTNSKYMLPRSSRICHMYGQKANILYSIKSMFKQNSTMKINIIFFIWLFLCTNAIRIAQYNYNENFKSFQNSLWCTFTTMVIIGYGDMEPITKLGFLINMFCMYTGVLIISIIIVMINNRFQLSLREHRSLKIMNSLQKKNQVKIAAAQYIKYSLYRLWMNKKYKLKNIMFQQSLKQKRLRQRFNKVRNQYKVKSQKSNLAEQFHNRCQKMFIYLDNLKQNQQAIIDYIQSRR